MSPPSGERGTMKGPIQYAAEALSDLNTFAIIVTLLEGGHVHADSHADAERIIAICKRAEARCLDAYDKYVAEAQGKSR